MLLIELLLILGSLKESFQSGRESISSKIRSKPRYAVSPHTKQRAELTRSMAGGDRLPDEQRLLWHVLRVYDPASRPVYNASRTVTVKFGYTLTQIADMDEVNQVLTTNVWLEQEWHDERLVWDPDDYNGLHTIRIPCQRIWLPDIVLYNSADDFTEGFMQSKAMVKYDGTVFWPPPAKLRSTCKIDITYFPFDDQRCLMKFGSWIYDGLQVDLTNRSDRVDLANYVFSGEWQLLDILVRRNEVRYACCVEPYPDVTFTIIMRRRTLYYLFHVIFPCLWLSVLSLLGFWLPADSGEKVTLGITVLLAFSVFMLLIAESMPATSEFVPLIGIYLTVTMGMTSLSIVLTVFVLQLHHMGPNRKPVPLWLKQLVVDGVARVICMQSDVTAHYQYRYSCGAGAVDRELQKPPITSVPTSNCDMMTLKSVAREIGARGGEISTTPATIEDIELQYEDMIGEWRLVAHVVDRFLFWIFLFATSGSSLFILVIMPMTKPKIDY